MTSSKTWLVTGCSSGIGLELVTQLAARGDRVYATCRKKESSKTGVDSISKVAGTGKVTILDGVDITDEGVGAMLMKALGGVKLDAVIHNAGGYSGGSGDSDKAMD